jgi:hypothetical protein
MAASPVVESALVEAFRRDGAVCVRGAFSEEDLGLAETAIEANLTEPSERALVASRPDDPGRFPGAVTLLHELEVCGPLGDQSAGPLRPPLSPNLEVHRIP